MAGQSISVEVLAKVFGERELAKLGDEFAKTAVTADAAAASLKVWNDVGVKSKKATDTLISSQLTSAKAFSTLAKAQQGVRGEFDKSIKALGGTGLALDDTGKKAIGLGARFSALAGSGGAGGIAAGGGMGALVGAGVALSGQITTLGFGFGGLALAAYGVIKPIEKAAQASGGLQKNLHTLDPLQQAAARSLLGLEHQYDSFQRSLKPEILTGFNDGFRIAGHLMHDVQPIAAATGKALNQVLVSVDKEFQSGTWQSFFKFMAQQAGPDVRLLGQNFTDLLNVLPPLIKDLNPIGQGLLVVADDATKAAGGVVSFYDAFQKNVPISNQHTGNFLKSLDKDVVSLTDHIPGAKAVNNWLTNVQHDLTGTAKAAPGAAQGIQSTESAAQAAAARLKAMAAQVTGLNKAESTSLTTLTTYAGDLITTSNDAGTLRKALRASHDEIGLHTAAEKASFSAANQYITDLSNTATQAQASGRGVDGAISAIKHGLPILDAAKTKNRLYWEEVRTLHGWLVKLQQLKAITEAVKVFGSGNWTVVGAPHGVPGVGGKLPFATGGRVPGTGSGDTVPAMLTPGEAVVPKRLVPAVAPFLSAGGVPGFADGGIVPSYHGSVGGLTPWTLHNFGATVRDVTASVASSMASAFARTIRSAALTGGGGAASGGAVEALARRMFPWPGYMWTDFTLVENREAGWNIHARNPSSGAYGLAQFINGPSEYYQYGGNPNTAAGQLTGMFNYIRQRYGNPLAAWGHELSYGWYDRGGWLPTGASIAVNNTGRPEMVVPGGGRAGTTVINNVKVQVGHGTHPVAAAQEIVKLLNQGAKAGVRVRSSILGPG